MVTKPFDNWKTLNIAHFYEVVLSHLLVYPPQSPRQRREVKGTHAKALEYTGMLLRAVLKQLVLEKPNCFDDDYLYYFAHPVHWGHETESGKIEGETLNDFAATI